MPPDRYREHYVVVGLFPHRLDLAAFPGVYCARFHGGRRRREAQNRAPECHGSLRPRPGIVRCTAQAADQHEEAAATTHAEKELQDGESPCCNTRERATIPTGRL